jgi:hypothetical protein
MLGEFVKVGAAQLARYRSSRSKRTQTPLRTGLNAKKVFRDRLSQGRVLQNTKNVHKMNSVKKEKNFATAVKKVAGRMACPSVEGTAGEPV